MATVTNKLIKRKQGMINWNIVAWDYHTCAVRLNELLALFAKSGRFTRFKPRARVLSGVKSNLEVGEPYWLRSYRFSWASRVNRSKKHSPIGFLSREIYLIARVNKSQFRRFKLRIQFASELRRAPFSFAVKSSKSSKRIMADGAAERDAKYCVSWGDVRQGSHGRAHDVLAAVRRNRQLERFVTVQLDFRLTRPFANYVLGQHSDPRCIYVPPSTGKTFHSFRIAYSRCGTKPDLNGQFYENTVNFAFR